MVNVLEILYVATAASTLATVIAWVRGTRTPAQRLVAVAVTCALVSAALYWYLSRQG